MMTRTRVVTRAIRAVALATVTLVLLVPGIAGAQSDYPPSTTGTTNPCVPPTSSSVCGTTPTVQVKGASTLPFTGGDVALVAALGLGAVAAGTILVVIGRRRSTSAA